MPNDEILLVDDDQDVLGTLFRALTREGYHVRQADSGAEGLRQLEEAMPDLLILDIMMPHMDGLEVCRKLRSDEAYNHLPILFLSARSDTDEIVEGLDLGGDDYIVKPFEITELNARVRALLRRSLREPLSEQSILHVGELVLNSTIHQVEIKKRVVQLTTTEHRLLRYMLEHTNEVLSPQHLLQAVWLYPSDAGDPDLVRAHIRNLRAKIEVGTDTPQYIRTVHGVGYMLSDPKDS